MNHRDRLMQYSKEKLVDFLEDAAKNWLAHDGLWFLAAEEAFGIETAIQLDARAWGEIHRRRGQAHHAPPGNRAGGGTPALKEALQYRFYAYLNVQEAIDVDERTINLRMNECRVQAARKRKGLPDFPCKPVGLVEYAGFASTIDPRFRTRCIACPPDPHPDEYWCAWEFTLVDAGD